MRLAVFLSEDYDFMYDMLKGLAAKLKGEHELVGALFFPDKLVKYSGTKVYLAYLEIFGLAVFIKLAARSLAKRISILVDYFFRGYPFYSFNGICRRYGFKKLKFHDPNDPAVAEWIRKNDIDIILIFVGHILKNEILKAPKICVLNKHAALLPAYKGIFPVFWAMKNGGRIGVTIHKVTEEVDGGEVVLQKEYDADAGKSVYDYYKSIFADTPSLISESLRIIGNNKEKKCIHIAPHSYFSLPNNRDYREFRKQRHRFV